MFYFFSYFRKVVTPKLIKSSFQFIIISKKIYKNVCVGHIHTVCNLHFDHSSELEVILK